MSRRLLRLVISAGVFIFAVTVRAQTGAFSQISSLSVQNFPGIEFFLDVHNSQGVFVHGLEAGDIRLLEDGRPVQVADFVEMRPGVQVVYALNPGSSFSIRNSQGESRLDFVIEALRGWAQGRIGSTLDDLSLVVNGSAGQTHFSNPDEMLTNLEGLDFDPDALEPSLDLLSQAIDVAADSTPRAGMERAVLFITAPMEGDLSFGAQDLIARASQARIRIYIWLIGSREVFTSPQSNTLQQLAAETDGQFFAFAGDESFPSIESYLANLRDIYRIRYESMLRNAGTHELVVEFQSGADDLQPAQRSFDFEIQAPNPAFVNPDLEIVRRVPAGETELIPSEVNLDQLQPSVHELQILFDFPDGRVRSLVQSQLYVDGVLLDENLEPPYDRFEWDLSQYADSGQHLLRVEALDEFGLRGASIELPVEVIVDAPKVPVWANVLQNSPVLILPFSILILALIIFALIILGRIRPQMLRVPDGLRRVGQQALRLRRPALRQREAPQGSRLTAWVNRLNWPQRRMSPKASAYLEPMTDSESSKPLPISIAADEITFGSDQDLATIVIQDDSVQGLHARLQCMENGVYLLSDQGSIAGTWVNYAQVPTEGQEIRHGDLIHLGRVGYRFKQRDAKNARLLVIRSLENYN